MTLKEIEFLPGYTLRLDWNGFEKLSEAMGTPSFLEFDMAMKNIGPREIRLIIWAGLLHKYPELSPDDVKPLINAYLNDHSLQQLTEVLGRSLTEAGILAGGKAGDMGEPMGKTLSAKRLKI